MSSNFKTFYDYSYVTFDRTDICMKGIRYTTKKDHTCKIIKSDMQKMKNLLGDELFNWAQQDGKTIEIFEDEVWAKDNL